MNELCCQAIIDRSNCSITTSRLPALSLASELNWSTASLDEDLSEI